MLGTIPKKISDTSPASASTAVSAATLRDMSAFDAITILATLTGATGGTLDVYLQSSWDGGVTWYDLVHFTQLAAAGVVRTYKATLALSTTITTVGKGSVGTPGVALAAATVAAGHWGDLIRAVYVAGASTSAGAPQLIEIFGSNARR